jgi:hypothetical protein
MLARKATNNENAHLRGATEAEDWVLISPHHIFINATDPLQLSMAYFRKSSYMFRTESSYQLSL